MPLLTEIKYETKIREFEDVSSAGISHLLEDIREEIGKLEPLFKRKNLSEILKIVEKGSYLVSNKIPIKIDLSEAEEWIATYKENSEGGCQSCVHFERDIFNDDMDSFLYCGIKEDSEKTPKECGYGMGFSPMTKKHYHSPCSSWKPRFSPKLAELVKQE